jgi:hypothetical protein
MLSGGARLARSCAEHPRTSYSLVDRTRISLDLLLRDDRRARSPFFRPSAAMAPSLSSAAAVLAVLAGANAVQCACVRYWPAV